MSHDAPAESTGPLPTPEGLGEELLDALALGTFAATFAEARSIIDLAAEQIEPGELLRYRLVLFDVALVSLGRSDAVLDCAVDLLTAVIETGEMAWLEIRDSSRRNDLERLATPGDAGFELLELLAYVPDTGMRSFAISQMVSAGLRSIDAGEDSRRVERLLHGIGASAQAYRIERLRKERAAGSTAGGTSEAPQPPVLPYEVIAIAGGHAQMRATAARLLARHGIRVVPIPSSREAVRRERDILQSVQGCDAVLVLVRQITHSTSDQVRKAAERLGVQVIFSNATSAVAIERQLFGQPPDSHGGFRGH